MTSSPHVSFGGRQVTEYELSTMIDRYAAFLHKMEFEKARELLETERLRDLWTDAPASLKPWQTFINYMSQLASTESQYFSLTFLVTKFEKFSFRNKDGDIRDTYLLLRNEFQRCFETQQDEPKSLLADVAHELRKHASFRIELIGFYISLPGKDWKCIVRDSVERLEEIQGKCKCEKNHLNLLDSIIKEIDVLQRLFDVQQKIAECNMLESLLKLKELKAILNEWFDLFDASNLTQPSSSFLLSFTKKTKPTLTKLALFHFLDQFFQTMLAKFSLYFHDVLTPFAPNSEMKPAYHGNPRFLHLFQIFFRKNSPQMICLLVNRIEMDAQFYGFGYHKALSRLSTECCKPASGINEKYPPLFFCPQDKRLFETLHANITSLVQDVWLNQSTSTQNDGKIKYLFDKNKEQSFFTANVESNIYLIVVYDRKVQEKEGSVIAFFNDALMGLRLVKLFQDLKNLSKT